MNTRAAGMSAALLLAAGGCTTNPSTGRSQLLLMSTQESIAVGEEAKGPLIAEYGGVVPAPALRSYVAEIGADMSGRTEAGYPGLPWEFTVLDSDVVNAFALPGGKVFVSRGLLARLDNEAQLAAVLGHEIGHVTAEHVNERVSQALGVQLLVIGSAAAAGQSDSQWAQVVPVLVGAGGQGYLLHFNRRQELEADRQGVKYMVAAGYAPDAMIELLQVLRSASGPGGRTPEILATHPYPETRIEAVQKLLAGPYAAARSDPRLQKHPERYREEVLPSLPPARAALPAPVLWCGVCRDSSPRDARRAE
jgi:predicted Zn-dependent protease